MRIVEACFTPALGGLELYCLNSARHLQDRGHQVQLWLAEGGRAANHPITSEIDTLLFCEPFYFDPGFLYRARRILQEQNIDVVHLHRTKDLGALSWIGGIAYILTLQIDSTRQKKDLYHRFVFSRAAKLLTITNRMKRLAESNLGIRAEKIHTLYHGIDSAALSLRRDKDRSLRGSMGIPAEAVVFGIIGRLEWGKGQWALLKALKQIYDKYPNAHLLIVGEPPPEGAGFDTELKRMAEEMGIADRTHFTGFLMDTAEAYSAMDVCVLASKKESFGLVLLEAMAFGLPIIATDAGGVPEIIEPGVNGLLVKPEDSQNLAEAMVCLLKEPDLREKLGKSGLEIVARKFSLTNHIDELERYFMEAQDWVKGQQR